MKYLEQFEEEYRDWFSKFESSNLVKHERILSQLIDDDLFRDSLFIDQAIVMYDLIRDECVKRVSKLAE